MFVCINDVFIDQIALRMRLPINRPGKTHGYRNLLASDEALKNKDVSIVYPVHPNPNVTGPVNDILGGIDNIILLPSLHYRDLVRLMSMSYMILTDSLLS